MGEFTAAAAENYDRFMGRYAVGLAPKLADAAGVAAGMRVVDVGCGPGGLTVELARRAGEENVAGIDPAPGFAAACQERLPGADIREGVAEALPWGDGEFDAALSSLVVAFMTDAHEGIREMLRDLYEAFSQFQVEFTDIRDLGDRVVAIGRWITRGEESGIETTPPLASVVEFRDGKAIRVRSYLDPKEALADVGLRE